MQIKNRVTTAQREGAMHDTVVVSIKYHGKRYTTTRRVTLAALMVDKNALVKQCEEGARKCIFDALKAAKKGKRK